MFTKIKPGEGLLIVAGCLVFALVTYETIDGMKPVMLAFGRLLEMVGRGVSMLRG